MTATDPPADRRGPLTVADVAELHSVSAGTVLTWIRAGELAAVNVGRRPGARKPRWRITAAALERFEAWRAAPQLQPRERQRRQRPADVIEFIR
jgi:excisionase family DNA binding protein